MTTPVVTSVTVPAADTYLVGESLDFMVNFSASVNNTGTPRLSLTIGSTTRYADMTSNASFFLNFSYVVVLADIDTNGIVLNSLELNGGTITESAAPNDPADLTLNSVGDLTGVLVGDVTAPVVTNVNVPAAGTYSYGGGSPSLDFYVTFSEYVTVVGTPRLTLNINVIDDISPATRYADYVSGSGGSSLLFSHAVLDPNASGDFDLNGIGVVSLGQNGGSTIQDGYGNNADLTLNGVGGTSGVLVNADCPYVDNYSRPWGNYNTGDPVYYFVNWKDTESVDVTGTPRIALTGGRYATYYAGSGSGTFTFRYVVQGGDTGGLSITGSAIELNGGTVSATDDSTDAIRLLRNGYGPGEVTMNDVPVWNELADNLPLFMRGIDSSTDSLPLFMTGHEPSTGSITLTIPEVLGYTADSIPLVLSGWDALDDSLPLFVHGHELSTGSVPLFLWGELAAARSMPLFLKGDEPDAAVGSLLLNIRGSLEAGVFAGIPLFIYSDELGQTPTRSMPLYLLGESQSGAVANMNLWIQGRTHSSTDSLDLVVWNDQLGAFDSIPLFIRGYGVTEGATPFATGMNLVLQRDPANAITLYIQGPGEELTGDLDLFVSGSELSVGSLDLAIPEVLGFISRTATLFTSGF